MKRYIKCSSPISNSRDFEIDDKGTLIKYMGPGGDVVIPEGVTEIDWYAFYENESVTSVKIPNSVTKIGSSAFFGCTALKEIVIPDSVKTIEPGVFSCCKSLKRAIIGNGVTNIPYGSFKACFSLTDVVIGNSVDSIGTAAFEKCTSLETLIIPSNVKSIDKYVFSGCTSLNDLKIMSKETQIDEHAFDSDNYLSDEGSKKSCTITYFQNTAAAERRSADENDVEDEIITTNFNASDELKCLETAFDEAGINSSYCETVEDYLDYLNNQDIGDGEPYMLKIIYKDELIYESNMSESDIIEEIKQDIE